MKYTVIIPLPERKVYHIDANYPEEAKRKAASVHREFLPKLPLAEIALLASCFKDNPKTAGGRPKNPALIHYIMDRPFLG